MAAPLFMALPLLIGMWLARVFVGAWWDVVDDGSWSLLEGARFLFAAVVVYVFLFLGTGMVGTLIVAPARQWWAARSGTLVRAAVIEVREKHAMQRLTLQLPDGTEHHVLRSGRPNEQPIRDESLIVLQSKDGNTIRVLAADGSPLQL